MNQPEKVSFEVGSEIRLEGRLLACRASRSNISIIDGPTPKDVLERYTGLTGRPALPPPWSFGLWLTTSFTTDYDEKTVTGFVDGMAERDLPLHVFHFDCFWMRAEFTGATSNGIRRRSPIPRACSPGSRPRASGSASGSIPTSPSARALFDEGMAKGYLLKRPDGRVWQWDNWQSGMAYVDFTNPAACAWYAGYLERLVDDGRGLFQDRFRRAHPD